MSLSLFGNSKLEILLPDQESSLSIKEQQIFNAYTKDIPDKLLALAWHNFLKRVVNIISHDKKQIISFESIIHEISILVDELERMKTEQGNQTMNISPHLFLSDTTLTQHHQTKETHSASQEIDDIPASLLQRSITELALLLSGHVSSSLTHSSFTHSKIKNHNIEEIITKEKITAFLKNEAEKANTMTNNTSLNEKIAEIFFSRSMPSVVKYIKVFHIIKKPSQ